MIEIENMTFDEERALYGSRGIAAKNCRFDGPADGESAFKESSDIIADNCYFNLRYPFWHDKNLTIRNAEITENCRAALWYSENIRISESTMHGIKALRECRGALIENCDIVSPEFGWSSENVTMRGCTAESEYFFLRGKNLDLSRLSFKGKYSFQYVEDAVLSDSVLETKDAFWHCKNMTVKNCVIKGEYLAWYSEGLTLENCTVIGTQPFCYCKNLRLVNCKLLDADLAFEKSEVYADVTTPMISIKNPKSGIIRVPSVQELIRTDPESRGEIVFTAAENQEKRA